MTSSLTRQLLRLCESTQLPLLSSPPSPLLVRRSSDTVHHTWPPSNQLTNSLLNLVRESLSSANGSRESRDVAADADAASHFSAAIEGTADGPIHFSGATRDAADAESLFSGAAEAQIDVTSAAEAVRRPFPVIVDLTFGNGFHSRAILEEFRHEKDLTLFAVDRDPKAVELAEELRREETRRVVPIHCKFSDCLSHFQSFVSHPGFADVVLIDAVVGALSRTHLAQILKKYGDERKNKALASLIYDTKYAFGPIQTTLDFAKVISSHAYKPYQSERDFSSEQKRLTMNSFRALRYFVNDELNELHAGIEAAFVLLKQEGLLLVSAKELALNRVIKDALDAFQGQLLPLEEEAGPVVGRAVTSHSLPQGEANPGLIFPREAVEPLLVRKWKRQRKELVLDDVQNDPQQQQQQQYVQHQQHVRLRAVTKNPLFDYRASSQRMAA